MKNIFFLIATVLAGVSTLTAQRYLTPVFSTVDRTNDIQYGAAVNYQGQNEVLELDFYAPNGDTASERPLLIYIHGGGFVDTTQSKSLVHIVAYCDSLARRGYAVASIDYRLDTSISNRAVIHAMHDAKAAVRFFKANAQQYKIDTSLVFMAGESAGAITSITTAYIDKPAEVQYPPTGPFSSDISVEGGSGNPGFGSVPKAALCLCGGTATVFNEPLFDTLAIETNTDPALLMVHGTSDPLIPTVRSLEIALRATHIGLPNLYFAYNGATHCPWFFPLPNSWAYLDTLIDNTVPFLYACVQAGQTGVDQAVSEVVVTFFPNPAKGELKVKTQGLGNEELNFVFTNALGGEVFSQKLERGSQQHVLNIHRLPPGLYFVRWDGKQARGTTKIWVQ